MDHRLNLTSRETPRRVLPSSQIPKTHGDYFNFKRYWDLLTDYQARIRKQYADCKKFLSEQLLTIVFVMLSLYFLWSLLSGSSSGSLSDQTLGLLLFASMLLTFLSYLTTYQQKTLESKASEVKQKEKISINLL